MRAVAIAAVLLLVAGSVSADLHDGFDWAAWSTLEKAYYVTGVAAALELMSVASYAATEDEERGEAMFRIPGTIGDMMGELDRYFAVYANREQWIVVAILAIADKLTAWFPTLAEVAK